MKYNIQECPCIFKMKINTSILSSHQIFYTDILFEISNLTFYIKNQSCVQKFNSFPIYSNKMDY